MGGDDSPDAEFGSANGRTAIDGHVSIDWAEVQEFELQEVGKMLRLTPLEETISGQELIKNERVNTVIRQVTRKFALSSELAEAIQLELEKLDLDTLRLLLDQILEIDAVEQLEQWLADHQPLHMEA